MKVYRREQSRRSSEPRHATLTACRTSLDHRDAGHAADDAAARVLNRHRLSPNARRRSVILGARHRAMRERNVVQHLDAPHAAGRSARQMRSESARRS
jgi:hypothetical protein